MYKSSCLHYGNSRTTVPKFGLHVRILEAATGNKSAACHLAHTHPLLLILHQYFLQSHLLAGQAMLCLKHLPAGGEGDPKPIRPPSQGPPLPHQERKAGKRGLPGGAGPGIEGTRLPTTSSLRSLSEPLLPPLSLFSPRPLSGRSAPLANSPLQPSPFPITGIRLLPASQLRRAQAGWGAA